MNEKDVSFRKQWFGLLIVNMLISIGNSFLDVRCNPLFQKMPEARVIVFSISLVAALIVGFLLYRCSYKKQGTKLLIFCLIASGVSLMINPYLYFSGKLSVPSYFPYYHYYLVALQLLGLYWTVLCWKMLKINKRLKAHTP